jgi:hypothetical protein
MAGEVTPDTSLVLCLDGTKLRLMVGITIQDLADGLKRDMNPAEVAELVRLLTEDGEDSEPEPDGSDSKPEDSEDCKDPESSDDGEPEPGDGDNPEDFDPYDYDDDYYEPGGDGEGDGTRELIETVDAVIAEKEAGDGTGPAAFMPGSGGIPPKREQKDYPDDIKAALEKLGLDPSKL